MDIEKIRAFLYDLDRIRSDADAVHNLILTYMGISENKPSGSAGTVGVIVEIGEIDGDDIKLHVTVDGNTESLWFNISGADDADWKRLASKEGDCILDTKI